MDNARDFHLGKLLKPNQSNETLLGLVAEEASSPLTALNNPGFHAFVNPLTSTSTDRWRLDFR